MVDNHEPRTDNSHPREAQCPAWENSAPVAQLDRVPGYEPGGREFESLRARQLEQRVSRFFRLALFLFPTLFRHLYPFFDELASDSAFRFYLYSQLPRQH